MKEKLEAIEEEKKKIVHDKEGTSAGYEKELSQFKGRERNMEADKLQLMAEKNKEIEKLKLDITSINSRLK